MIGTLLKGVTKGRTDRRTERVVHGAAWSQLEMIIISPSFTFHKMTKTRIRIKTPARADMMIIHSAIFFSVLMA